jgi:hypothetical protein
MAWQYTKNGMFFVKSAYHIEWDHQFGSRGVRRDAASTDTINPIWEKVWKLTVPRKVKQNHMEDQGRSQKKGSSVSKETSNRNVCPRKTSLNVYSFCSVKTGV